MGFQTNDTLFRTNANGFRTNANGFRTNAIWHDNAIDTFGPIMSLRTNGNAMGFRTNANANGNAKAMGRRTNGISDQCQWVVGPMAMGCRTVDMAPLCL